MRGVHRCLTMIFVLALFSIAALARADSSSTPQIVGGQDVPDPNPYTYQVSVGTADATFCGGSIIAVDWVLSAAHCFVDSNTGVVTDQASLVVRVGLRDIRDGFNSTAADRAVSRLIVHEAYDPQSSANDIALLQLAAPADPAWIVPLAGVANDAALTGPGTQAIATGWGAVEQYAPGEDPPGIEPTPAILRYVQLPIAANALCGIAASQLCAGLPQGGIDTCQGDSGGPLVVSNGAGGYIQVGVVSYGAGCAWPDNYGVYTRVSAYGDWINAAINPLPLTPRAYLPFLAR